MEEKYQNKYRIPSNRLQDWDYGNNGIYFITICTHNQEHFLGKIENGNMHLNEMGIIVKNIWLEIPKQFPYIQLGAFVIMPNHIHGLLTVETQFIASENRSDESVETQFIASGNRPDDLNQKDAINCVSTGGEFAGNKNPLLNENISRVIRWYKGRCSFEIRKIHADFSWQTRFYDHIVRNQQALKNIEDYIEANPYNWLDDKFYKI